MSRKSTRFDAALFFRALADQTRLRLVNLMGDDEVCVCFLVEALGMSQPKISRHLAYLRRGGIVTARRQGKWMHYRLMGPEDPDLAAVLTAVRRGLEKNLEMHSDRLRLTRLCCSPAIAAPLKRAPKPASVSNASTP